MTDVGLLEREKYFVFDVQSAILLIRIKNLNSLLPIECILSGCCGDLQNPGHSSYTIVSSC